MQLIRERSFAQDVLSLVMAVPPERLGISSFSVHGLGVAMKRHRLLDHYPTFLQVMSIGRAIQIVEISIQELGLVAAAAARHGLDFDDAYQYVAAELNDLKLVSLDADFDRTPNGCLTPAAASQLFKDETTP